jgi:serine/threonine protein kinase
MQEKRLFNKKLVKVKKIGEGAYGSVYKTYTIEDSEKPENERKYFVVKKMETKFFNEGINFSALREIKILKEIKHPNILELLDIFYDKTNLFLSYELLDLDLYHLIEDSKNIVLTESIIKGIMLQIFKGMSVVHHNNVIHRDLKPQNILINIKEGLVKIADFGMARYIASYERGMTRNVVTSWYRSPELFFGSSNYTYAVDIWSIGCIMGELLQKEPMFPGDGDIQILTKIFHLIGVPNDEVWEGATELINFKTFIQGDVIGIKNQFSSVNKVTVDLLERLLTLDPLKRISTDEALKHDYFQIQPYAANESELRDFLYKIKSYE